MEGKLRFVCRNVLRGVKTEDCVNGDDERTLIGTWTLEEIGKAVLKKAHDFRNV